MPSPCMTSCSPYGKLGTPSASICFASACLQPLAAEMRWRYSRLTGGVYGLGSDGRWRYTTTLLTWNPSCWRHDACINTLPQLPLRRATVPIPHSMRIPPCQKQCRKMSTICPWVSASAVSSVDYVCIVESRITHSRPSQSVLHAKRWVLSISVLL